MGRCGVRDLRGPGRPGRVRGRARGRRRLPRAPDFPVASFRGQGFGRVPRGELPATPLVVAWNDSVIDPSRAPEGKHLKKFIVLGVPYEIKGDATGHVRERNWDEAKEGYADYLIDRITANYIPDLKEKLLKREAHSPLDLERKLSSAVHGTICHGAMLPYQTGSMRPIPEMGDYRSPVENVYLCGSGSHPGPGVSMAPGRNAAETIFSDLGLDFGATVATGATRS